LATELDQQNLAHTVAEVSERASLLVREEIELAKTEVTEKLTKLVKGAAVGAVAGVFIITALFLLLNGLAWFAWFELPVGSTEYYWGFFAVAAALVLLGALAGFVAFRALKAGAPPTPAMAIDEARKIKDAVTPGEGGS
jgi:hypothetical protein